MIKNTKAGFGLVEVVVGATIIALCISSLVLVVQISSKVSDETADNTKVSFLLEEGVEAVKIIRDTGWSGLTSLTAGNNYYLEFNGTNWVATTSNVYVDDVFERKFVINDVYRDVNDDIAETGAIDNNTKKITISVSWKNKNATTTKSLSTYLTNLF